MNSTFTTMTIDARAYPTIVIAVTICLVFYAEHNERVLSWKGARGKLDSAAPSTG